MHKCILGRPFVVVLDVVAFPVHLKLKYHNVHGESSTINVDLHEAKCFYQNLQEDQKEGEA